MPRLRLSHLIQADIDRIDAGAAWTPDQRAVWRALLRDDLTDEGIMLALKLNKKRYYKTKGEIEDKIGRVMGGT